MRRIIPVAFFTALFLMVLLSASVYAQIIPTFISVKHCIGSGPISLPPDYCGCTWGALYYHDQAQQNISITLSFQSQAIYTPTTLLGAETYPYYELIGSVMGAKLNDVMTVTTQLAGQTLARPFRARPDSEGEQEVSLVLPDLGLWHGLGGVGYTRTATVQGDTLWAGGLNGVSAIQLSSGVSTAYTLPWSSQSVMALATAANGSLWAADPRNLAEFVQGTWQDRPVPFAQEIRSLAIDPANGALWLGGGDSSGALAVYNGAWQTITAVSEVVTAITVDAAGEVWVGTAGGGLYRHDHTAPSLNSGWTQIRARNGLASDYVNALASDANNLWVGTRGYLSNQSLLGGISRYRFSDQSWRTYTTTHGLPKDPSNENAPASVSALAVDKAGLLWAALFYNNDTTRETELYFLATPDRWLAERAERNNRIHALAVLSDTLITTARNGIDRLDRHSVAGKAPIAQIHTAPLTVTLDSTLVLTATASDPDETGGRILVWEWLADQDNRLCTTAQRCSTPAQLLGQGRHEVRLRVQDDEGVWSATAMVVVNVVAAGQTNQVKAYLPLAVR